MLQLGPRRAAPRAPRGGRRVVRPRARAGSLESSVLAFHHGEVLLQPGTERRRAGRAGARGRAEPRQRRRPLPAGLRARRPGPPRRGAGRVQARRPAQPGARRAPRPTCRSSAHRRRTAREQRAPRGSRSRRSPRATRSRTTTSARAFRQKGYYAEALREYRLALERGEDRRARAREAMAEVHLLRRDLPAALRAVRGAGRRVAGLRQAVERARRLPAPGRAAPTRRSRRTGGRSRPTRVRASPATTSAWLLVRRRPTEQAVEAFRDGPAGGPTLITPRASTSPCCSPSSTAPAVARGVPPGARDRARTPPPRGTASGSCSSSCKRYADASNAFARAVEADPEHARRALQPELHAVESRRLRGRAARDASGRSSSIPYYVPQKFLLAIELQFEDPSLSVAPEISADVRPRPGGVVRLRSAPARRHLQGACPGRPPRHATRRSGPRTLSGWRATTFPRGSSSRPPRRRPARCNAAPTGWTPRCCWATSSRGAACYGEALERYREARALDPTTSATRCAGRCARSWRSTVLAEARPLAEQLLGLTPDDVEAAVLAAKARGRRRPRGRARRAAPGADARAGAGRRPQAAGRRGAQGRRRRAAPSPPTGRRSSSTRDTSRSGSRSGGCTSSRRNRGRRSRRTARHSSTSRASTRPRWRSPSAAAGGARRRGAWTRLATMLEQDPYDFEALLLLAPGAARRQARMRRRSKRPAGRAVRARARRGAVPARRRARA